MFYKSNHLAAAVAAAVVLPKDLDVNSPASIRSVASRIAADTMSYYTGNITNTPEARRPPPHACASTHSLLASTLLGGISEC